LLVTFLIGENKYFDLVFAKKKWIVSISKLNNLNLFYSEKIFQAPHSWKSHCCHVSSIYH